MSLKYPVKRCVPSPVQLYRSATHENDRNNIVVLLFFKQIPIQTSMFKGICHFTKNIVHPAFYIAYVTSKSTKKHYVIKMELEVETDRNDVI